MRARPGFPKGWHRWLYRLLAMTVVPLFLLLLLEGLLRLSGYGYPSNFFLPAERGGQEVFVENQEFGRRFFPPGLTRGVNPLVLPGLRTAGTYRIFILGESAAMGYPDASFHFGRILQAMLQERHPETRFEVVNTAFTAINSHVILPIAQECAGHQPDLFVIYMGNNEVVGPYGPSGVIGPFSPNLNLIRASVAVKATRTGQLLTNLIRLASHSGQPRRGWGGMTMFTGSQVPADDPRLSVVYANFKRNLQDVCAASRQAGAPVLVCTVATNLRDCAPFASIPGPALTSDQAAAWKQLSEEGIAQESAGDHAAAVACYRRALAIDARAADLHFRLGRCLATLKKPDEAHEHYVLARDLDALRFRADSGINETIRTTTNGREDEDIYLVDVERAFEKASGDGSPGEDLFYEHVHLTFEGNYLLARAVLEQLVRILPKSMRPREDPSAPCLSLQDCKERLPFTDWNRKNGLSAIAAMVGEPPFTGQLDHTERQERLHRQLEELKKRLAAGGAEQAVAAYRRALERKQGDLALHKDFAMLLREQGRLEEAAEQVREALKLVPHDHVQHSRLADILGMQGKWDQALACYAESVRLKPDDPQLHHLGGRLWLGAGKPDQAAAAFARAVKLRPDDPGLHANLGDALALGKQYDQAIAEFNEALRLDPNSAKAHFQLGQLLSSSGLGEEALVHFREALRIDPNKAETHIGLAKVLANNGQVDEAIRHLEEALRQRPNWPEVAQTLQGLRSQH